MLSADELAAIRGSILTELLTDTVELLQDTSGRGAGGGKQVTGSTVTATCAGRVLAMVTPPQEAPQGGETAALEYFQIRLPSDAAVLPSQRLRVGAVVYEVIGAAPGRTDAFSQLVNVFRVQ
jgi:hypothetical protein